MYTHTLESPDHGEYVKCGANRTIWHLFIGGAGMETVSKSQQRRIDIQRQARLQNSMIDDTEPNYKIVYPNGYIHINVANYFAKARLTDINKLIKLARSNGTDVQRNDLINKLVDAKQYWANNHTKTFFRWSPRKDSQLDKTQQKLQRFIDLLNVDYLGDDNENN